MTLTIQWSTARLRQGKARGRARHREAPAETHGLCEASGVQKDILAEGRVRGFSQEAGAEKWGWGVRAEHWNRSH